MPEREAEIRWPRFSLIGRIAAGGLLLVSMVLFIAPAHGAGVVTDCTESALRIALTNGGTITFTGSCSITLTQQIIITTNTVIETGGNSVILSGGDSNRIFMINSGATLAISGATLMNGRSTNGGAIFVNTNASVHLTNCTLTANNALGLAGVNGFNGATNAFGNGQNGGSGTAGTSGLGGSIYNAGTITLYRCLLSANNATGGDGGNGGKGGDAAFQGGNGGLGASGGAGSGGAIYSLGALTASDCTFSNNVASGGAGGASGAGGFGPFPGLAGSGGLGGLGAGGGLFTTQATSVINCSFADNQTQGGNSGNGGTLANGNGVAGGRGADSLGGGLFNGGTLAVTNSTFYQNKATGGIGGNGGYGDFYAGNGGAGGDAAGGGLCNTGTVTVVNVTFSHGSASGGTNGMAGTGNYAGINGVPGQNRGGNIARLAGVFTIRNSILATNLSGGAGYGTVTDGGNNISADTSLALGATSLTNTNANLGALADNGGFTMTMMPLSGSPAVNGGNDTNAPALDQRGFTRPLGAHVDIGSVEALPAAIATAPQSQTVIAGSNATFTVTATGDAPLTYQWQFNGTNITSATSATYTINGVTTNHAGSYRVIVTNDYVVLTSAVATLTVLVPPAITIQPADVAVLQGGTANFTVAATGDTPLSYQWRFNGTNLAGANGTGLTLTNAQSGNAGSYDVVVTNVAGSVTSALRALKVLISPSLTTVTGTATNFGFSFATVLGSIYEIQFKTNLSDVTWISVATNSGTGSLTNYFVNPAGFPHRFYRVLVR